MNFKNAIVILTVSEESQPVLSAVTTKRLVEGKLVKEIDYKLLPRECKRNTKLTPAFTNATISNEAPRGVDKFVWNHMGARKKLEYHLNLVANGQPFSYEVIED